MSSQNHKKNKSFYILLFYWLPFFLWAAVIFTFSSFPTRTTSEINWQDFAVKKTAHIVVYFVLTLLSYRVFLKHGVKKEKAALISMIASVFYGLSDEYHQSFTPGRDPRLRDVGFDTIGAVLAIYFIKYLLPKMPKEIKILAKEIGLYSTKV